MDIFLKITASVLIATIASLVISRYSYDISLLLTILVCCMAMVGMAAYIKPIIDFLEKIVGVGQIDNEIFRILLKTAGIGMISQVSNMICTDAGNQTLGKVLQLAATVVIVCLCIPLFDKMLSLIESVLEAT